MGGGTAVDVALEYPERITGIVVSGSGTSEPEFRDPWVLELLATWQRTQEAGDAEGWIEAFMRFVPGPHRQLTEVEPEVTGQVEQMVRDTLAHHLVLDEGSAHAGRRDLGAAAGDRRTRARRRRRHRRRRPSADGAQARRVGAARAPVVIEDTAHYPNMERLEAFNVAVAEQLATKAL